MYPIKCFDVKPFIDAAQILLCSDETLMALKLLDMVPAYYRDNYPPEMKNLKREIMAKIATASFYATDAGCELETTDESCASYIGTLRAQLIVNDVKMANLNGETMYVYDFAPGENWLPVVLEKAGCDFAYKPIYVNGPTNEKFKYRYAKYEFSKPNGPTLYSACEVLEHVHCFDEIRFDMESHVGLADIVLISTPNGTFNPNVTDWRGIGTLGHLRTFQFGEFKDIISKMFFDYSGAYYDSQILGARLVNASSKYDFLKTHYKLEG